MSPETAEAWGYTDDDQILCTINGVGEEGIEQVIHLPCIEEDLTYRPPAQIIEHLRSQLRALTHDAQSKAAQRHREAQLAPPSDYDHTANTGTIYRWCRTNLDRTQTWAQGVAAETITRILGQDPDAIIFHKSEHSRRIATTVNILGFAALVTLGHYNVASREAIAFAPEFVPIIDGIVRNDLDASPARILVQDKSNPSDHIFGWPLYQSIRDDRDRSGRELHPRNAARIPDAIVKTVNTAWAGYGQLNVPAAVWHRIALGPTDYQQPISGGCCLCQGGPHHLLCNSCDADVRLGIETPADSDWMPSMKWGIEQLAKEFGGPMTIRQVVNRSITRRTKDPAVKYVARMLARQGAMPWTHRLILSGVAGDGYRPGWGLISQAADGHMCRSLLERVIDDFMFNNGIAHELEPSYPEDSELNQFGLRADWLLRDGTFVEAFGALSRADYASKAHTKRLLAAKHGIRLIEITPEDILRLHDLLGPWSERGSA